jgi:uncharacterized protein YjiS (DUF1127 family)
MFAANQDKADRSIGRVLKDVGRAFLEQLVFIGDQLGLLNVFRWLKDEWRLNAAIRELSRLNDHYLDDIGIRRSELRERALQRAECRSAMADSSFSPPHRDVMRIEARRLI